MTIVTVNGVRNETTIRLETCIVGAISTLLQENGAPYDRSTFTHSWPHNRLGDMWGLRESLDGTGIED